MNIIITGASSGLGAELSKIYAAPDITLGLLGRDQERLNKTAQYCRDQGANVISDTIDITHTDTLIQWTDKFDSQHPVDLIIANAGIMTMIKRDNCLEDNLAIKNIFDINYFGSLNTINPVLEKMCNRKHGHVVVISSLSAYRGIPLFPAYSASKAALKSHFEGMRGMLLKDNIFVTIICPSFIDTTMIKGHSFQDMFVMDAKHAAQHIKKSIGQHRRVVSFPLYHLLGIKLLELLPNKASDWILMKFLGL